MRRLYKILRKIKVLIIRSYDILMTPNFRRKFPLLINSRSQAGQESFAAINSAMCKNKYYLEIGAGDAIKNSNTFILDSKLNWKGLSIDINPKHFEKFSQKRNNYFLIADATKINLLSFLEKYQFPKLIAYLQIDTYHVQDSYKILEQIPFNQYKFCSITFEHDLFDLSNSYYAEKSRELLNSKGYKLLCKNVKHDNLIFEDWWILPECSPRHVVDSFHSENKNGIAHFSRLSQIYALKNYLFASKKNF